MVALLTKCCCGCSLRTGTIIIGCIAVIVSLYFIVANSLAITAIDAIKSFDRLTESFHQTFKDQNNFGDNNFGGSNFGGSNFGGSNFGDSNKVKETTNDHNAFNNEFKKTAATLKDVKWFIVFILFVRSIQFILSIVMLAGALMEKPKLLVPWMIYEIILAIIETIQFIVVGIQFANHGLGWWAVGQIAPLIVGLLLTAYFLYVVYSHYKTSSQYDVDAMAMTPKQ